MLLCKNPYCLEIQKHQGVPLSWISFSQRLKPKWTTANQLQTKDPGGNYERIEFFDPRETPFTPNKPPVPFQRHGKHKQQARGASHVARPAASSDRRFSAKDKREKPGRGDGRPNLIPPGTNDPYGLDIASLNIFETQIAPVVVHNRSKSFRPNMTIIRVLLWGQSLFLNEGTLISNSLQEIWGKEKRALHKLVTKKTKSTSSTTRIKISCQQMRIKPM